MSRLRALPFALALFLAPALAAQPQPPGCGPSGGQPRKCTPVPIDGGIGLLAVAGGVYAAAQLRRREDDEG